MPAMSPTRLSLLSDLIGRWTGLHFPEDRYAELERGIARAAEDFGHRDADAFANLMMASELTTDQIKTLAWHLTIGETYFLRGKSTFEVLEKDILPDILMARRGKEQQLRIWSAGCSGGEEAYSLAITASRLLPDVSAWNTTILATDINTRALNKAQGGVYGNWSFRDAPAWLREQFFTAAANGDWEIRQQIKRMVTFSYLNLNLDPYPSLATNTNAMDIIFCRNVIMYFSPEVMRRVIDNLHGALREGGYLFVAPSEASQELFPQFVRQSLRGEIFFKKDAAALAEQEARKLAPRASAAMSGRIAAKAKPAAPPRKLVAVPRPSAPALKQRPAAAKAAAKTPADAGALAAGARAAANLGRLSEALEQVERAIAADKIEAAYHYLYATILEELAQPEDAVKALTSALFLDPDFALAHFLNGNIARRSGRAAEARRHFEKTLVALETRPAEEVLPESEGMTAGKLAEIVKSLLEMEVAR